MANWKQNAINDLREYPYLEQSLTNIPQEIKRVEEQMVREKGVAYDKTPVQGGCSGAEDRIIECIDRKERLWMNLRVAEEKAARIEKGMSGLNDRERKVLDSFYVHRSRHYIENLCEEMNCERAQVYRIKDFALKKFTLSMFGVVDL